MTAATAAESRAAVGAWTVYYRVMRSAWPGGKGRVIREALDGLTDALETYAAVLSGDIHPASAYCELEGEPEALSKALEMSLRDAADWADELDRLVPVETERSAA